MNPIVADGFVSLAAVAGLLVLRSTLKRSDRSSEIGDRFSFAISVLIWMLGARVLFWWTGFDMFRLINLAAASLIPLAMLILCEGLMRRHGPRILKVAAVAGPVVILVLALIGPNAEPPLHTFGLLGFQVLMFCAIGFWVLRRQHHLLSPSENRLVDRLALSLLLIIPLAISDFRIGVFNSPVQLSGIAILFLCWLSLSLDRVRVNHLQIVTSFLTMLVGVAVAAFAIAMIADIDAIQTVQIAAIILSTGLFLQVYSEARSLIREDERGSLLQYVATSKASNASEFLRGLQRHPLVAGALILQNDDLVDFDEPFRAHIRQRKILSSQDGANDSEPSLGEQVRWLLENYNATHAIYAGKNPFTIVVLNMPSIASVPGAELELAVVQRVAGLMADAGTPK